jgi:type IV pilus assembly protein PilM
MIAVDVGTRYVKICRLDKKGNDFDAKLFLKEIRDDDTPLNIIKDYIKSENLKNENVITSVGDSRALVRKLELPEMPAAELKSTIKLQAERMIYADLNDMDMDYHLLDSEQKNMMEILLVAVPRALVNERMSLIQNTGLNPVVVEIDNLAQANSFLTFEPEAAEQKVVLLDIGHSKSCFTILNKGKFCFTRNVDFGGQNITEVIAKDLQIPETNAEELKKLPEKWSSVGLNIKNILRKSLPDLLEAIYKSIEYCRSQHLIDELDKILITGGTANLNHIDDFFVEILGMEIERWNPLNYIASANEKEKGLNTAIALGMALRKFSNV